MSKTYVCFGDSITSDQVTGIGTLIAQIAGFRLLNNYATGYCTCSDWHNGNSHLSPISLVIPPNTNTSDNVLSNQIRRFLQSITPLDEQINWRHPKDGEFSIQSNIGKGLGMEKPDIVYIAVSANDGNNEANILFDDTKMVFKQSYRQLTCASMASALRWAIETIFCVLPNAKIFVATPLQTFCENSWMSYDSHMLKRKIVMDVAEFCHVHVIDSFMESGFTAQVAKHHGEIHPDDEWKCAIAGYVARSILSDLY